MTTPRDSLARVVLFALWEQDRRVEACLMGKSFREDDAYTAADALLESDWLAEQYAAQRAEGAREALAGAERRLEAWIRHGEAVPDDVTTYERWIVHDELRALVGKVHAEQGGYDHSNDVPPHTHGCAPIEQDGA